MAWLQDERLRLLVETYEVASDTSIQLDSGDISGIVRRCSSLRTPVPRQAPWRPGRCTFCLPRTNARHSFHRWHRTSFAQGRSTQEGECRTSTIVPGTYFQAFRHSNQFPCTRIGVGIVKEDHEASLESRTSENQKSNETVAAHLLCSMTIRFAVRKRCYTGLVTVIDIQMAARRIGWIGQMLEKVFTLAENARDCKNEEQSRSNVPR